MSTPRTPALVQHITRACGDEVDVHQLRRRFDLCEKLEMSVPDDVRAALMLPCACKPSAHMYDAPVKLKQRALASLSEAHIRKFTAIKKPSAATRRLVQLVILEIIARLAEGCYTAQQATDMRDTWSRLADRYGMWRLRYYLDDQIFHLCDPQSYRTLSRLIARQEKSSKGLFHDITEILGHHLSAAGVEDAGIYFRRKNIYGIHQKMEAKKGSINEVTDIFACRVVVPRVADCRTALAILHRLWRPYSHRFKDYLMHPKPNGYRSIHTTLHCLYGTTVEFQIRTSEMHYIAKYGAAAHDAYKAQTRSRAT